MATPFTLDTQNLSGNGGGAPDATAPVEDFSQYRLHAPDPAELDQALDVDALEITVRHSLPSKVYFRVDGREGRVPVLRLYRPPRTKHEFHWAPDTLVHPDIRLYEAFTVVTDEDDVYLVCLRRPHHGNEIPGTPEQRRVARRAMREWQAIEWEEQARGGLKFRAKAFPKMTQVPGWPDLPIDEVVRAAFDEEHRLKSADDPVLQLCPDMRGADDGL